MSSLEERREARRRRRMMEEAETDENEAIQLDKGMMRARREKENRLSRLAAEVNSFNEEDDYERKRRERREAREARLRSAPAEEEETTSRRRSRRNAEEEAPAEAPAVEEVSAEDAAAAAAAEEARKQQEAEEAARRAEEEEKRRREAEEQRKKDEADRERREAEEALQKIEDEKRAAEEAEQKRIDDEKRAVEEAERKKREAEEKRKRIHEDYSPPSEKKVTEFSVQSSHPYYNGHTMEDEDSVDTNDEDEDTSLDARSSPLSDNKDVETESRSCLSSSREDINDSHTDDGSLDDSADNERCSAKVFISHENNIEDEYSIKKGETYNKRASTLPDSDKVSVVKVHTSQYVASPIKEVQQQPNKKLDTAVRNFIPNRGSNLKDIQKKFETECNQPATEPTKRNKVESNGKGLIGSTKISTSPVINGLSKKDNSKIEKFKEVHIQFEMGDKTSAKATHIKNISVHNAVILPEKQLSLANQRRSSKENINNCCKWPPERGRSVKDLSEKYLTSAVNDPNSSSPEDKPLVGMKSVVKRWPSAHKAEISKTKVPESLKHSSCDQTSANSTEIKRDVRSRWPPPADPKQTARESISSAIALKLNLTDPAGIPTTNLRTNNVSLTSPTSSAASISTRWPPVSPTDKETKHSTVSAENRKLKEKTVKMTSEQITPLKSSSSWSQPESISPSQMHALKSPTFHHSFDATNNHLTKDAATTDQHSFASTHSLNETQFKLNDFHEEEEREEAERKRKQEEPPHESLPVGEKSLQLNQVHHLGLNEVDEEERKRQVLSERIMPLPDNLEELSKAQMQDLVKKLHGKMAELEEEVYDWEFKLRRQEFEINDLTLKVNDTRGKFVKPVLRKISKTEAKLAKLERTKKDDFRTTLKSGHKHDKIEEEEEAHGEAPPAEAPAEEPVEA